MDLRRESYIPAVAARERTLTFGADKRYATFDRSGRFLFSTEPGRAVRRGLDHRIVESVEGEFGRSYRDLDTVEKRALIQSLRVEISRYLNAGFGGEHTRRLEEILAWTPEKLEADQIMFQTVYKPISILPPDMYNALVVQVSEGCSYNRCAFCDFYRDRPFHIKSDAELAQHFDQLKLFFGVRLQDRGGVFLGDGNAMVIPTARLLEMIALLNKALPPALFADGIATFMDTFSLERKSLAELNTLRAAGMKTVYVGFETGADRLRTFLEKQGSAKEAYVAMALLKSAGYRLAVVLLVGAGGEEFAEEHVQETLALLKNLPLAKGDLVYLSPFVEPAQAEYRQIVESAGIHPLGAKDLHRQYETLRAALLRLHPAVKVSRYSITQHLY